MVMMILFVWCLKRFRAAVLSCQNGKQVGPPNWMGHLTSCAAFFVATVLFGCIPPEGNNEIRFIQDRAIEDGRKMIEVDKAAFRGAAAEDVTIVLEVGNYDGKKIVLLNKAPKWRLVEPTENASPSLGKVQILLDESGNYEVLSVSVFVKGDLVSNKILKVNGTR